MAWAPDDKLFPLELAQRLAATLPDARVETIAESRAFSMIDQPDRLAGLVEEVAAQRSAAGQAIR
jgi:pimeloyl-ACP methyl ester carboxylesterase